MFSYDIRYYELLVIYTSLKNIVGLVLQCCEGQYGRLVLFLVTFQFKFTSGACCKHLMRCLMSNVFVLDMLDKYIKTDEGSSISLS